MNLILVHYEETQHNLESRAIGFNTVALDSRGRLQTPNIAEALVSLAPVALHASPIPRALETATIISQKLNIEVHPYDSLKEANIEHLDRLVQEEIWQQYPDFRTWSIDASTAVMPDGESVLPVQGRIWNTIEEIRGLHLEENVAIVSHNFTLLWLVYKFLGMPLPHCPRPRLNLGRIT